MSEKILSEKLSLKEQLNSLEAEARMVLPGIQALFGFQLIAVFNQGFKTDLSLFERQLHFVALAFTAVSTLSVLTPAAFHRLAHRDCVDEKFIRIGSRWILVGMILLSVAVCLDFYLIAGPAGIPDHLRLGLALGLWAAFVVAWFVYPRVRSKSPNSL